MRAPTVRGSTTLLLWALAPAILIAACGNSGNDPAEAAGSAVETNAAAGKIPITTTSEEALDLYLQGRDLSERLKAVDAQPYLQEAVQKDPGFAAGYLLLANTAQSNEDFFANLELAVANMSGASEGERLQIQAVQAGVESRADDQLALLRELVAKYPDDERAHNLLGTNLFFARQRYDDALAEFRRAVEINPEFSPSWNLIGYAARFAGRNDEAEEAFRRYIELLPDEPNPYDSYAEFLMKVGRFDESIAQYRRALEVDSEFVFSHVGIANNQMFLGRGNEARQTLDEMFARARNDGQRRNALLWKAASHLHEGNRPQAMRVLEERRAIAESTADWLAVANDDVLIGRLWLDLGHADEAERLFAQALPEVEKAEVPQEVKEGLRRNDLYNQGLVAIAKGDLAAAREKSRAYHAAVQEPAINFELQQDHELMGRIALADGNAAEALTHLGQANQQDPRVLLLTAEAHRVAGDAESAREMARQAAEFNQLSFPLSYVRTQAQTLARG